MMRQACYGTLGYRPTDRDLRRLSLLQYTEAMIGRRDDKWASAGIVNAALMGVGPGHSRQITSHEDYEDIKKTFGVA